MKNVNKMCGVCVCTRIEYISEFQSVFDIENKKNERIYLNYVGDIGEYCIPFFVPLNVKLFHIISTLSHDISEEEKEQKQK